MNHIVEYISDRAGEDPFVLGDKKYQFVTALYPSGKKDIGVYVFGNDMVLDYEYWMDQNFISYEKGGSISDLEKKNPTLKASREHEKRDKDFEIFEVSVEAEAMMDAEGAEALEAIEIPAMGEIGADGAEAVFKKGGVVDSKEFEDFHNELLQKVSKLNGVEILGERFNNPNKYGNTTSEIALKWKEGEITRSPNISFDFTSYGKPVLFIPEQGYFHLEKLDVDEALSVIKNKYKFKKGGEIHSDLDWKGIIKGVDGLKKLPNRLSHYFSSTSKSKRFPMAKLNPTKMISREIARANKKMGAAYLGEGTKRAPITLRKVTDSKGRVSYDILDGNATFANAFFSGWKSIIGEIVDSVKETKQPSLSVLAQQIRKKGESLSDARKRAEMRLKKYKDGGDIEVSIVNEGVVFDKEKYPSIFGDSDMDKIPNVDDPNPQKAGDKKSIEQVKLSDVFERLLNVKEGLDVRMKKVVQSMKEKAPSGSKISARTKTPYSIVNKLVNKRLGTLTDMIGTTIIVDNQQDLESLKDRVERGEFGQVLDFDNYYENPKAGYRAYHFIVDAEGVPTEVQLKTNRQKSLNSISHKPYKKEKLNAERLNELSLLAMRADMAEETAVNEFDMLMKYPKAVEKQLTLG